MSSTYEYLPVRLNSGDCPNNPNGDIQDGSSMSQQPNSTFSKLEEEEEEDVSKGGGKRVSFSTTEDPKITSERISAPAIVSSTTRDSSVTMRHSAVHPILRDEGGQSLPVNGDHPLKIHGEKDDMADGMEVFTNEPFTPLLSSNQYQVRKLAAQALMDVALMMANISQLRTLIGLGPSHSDNFYLMVTMVVCSLVFQVVFAILMFIILVREGDQQQKKDYLETINVLEERGGMSTKAKERARQSIVKDLNEFKHIRRTTHLNYITMVLVFLITVVNMFITGFGIHKS